MLVLSGCQSYVAMRHEDLEKSYVKKSYYEENLKKVKDEYIEKQSYYEEEQLESKHDSLEDCVKFLSIELARFKTKLINAIK